MKTDTNELGNMTQLSVMPIYSKKKKKKKKKTTLKSSSPETIDR